MARKPGMRKKLGVGAIAAGLLGCFLGAGTIFSSPDSNIMVGAFLVLCSLLSIALGIWAWRQEGDIPNYDPLLVIAGIAGAVIGMVLIVLMVLDFY